MFKNIDYLKNGNLKQQEAYNALSDLRVFEVLVQYKPIMVGTIPIEIDLDNSDIDIICKAQDLDKFDEIVEKTFGDLENFKQSRKTFQTLPSSVCSFLYRNFEIELFAQSKEPEKQNAYRHMIVEYRILNLASDSFKKEVIRQKQKGLKTEPAFAKLLELKGDPYLELLKLEGKEDRFLKSLLRKCKTEDR